MSWKSTGICAAFIPAIAISLASGPTLAQRAAPAPVATGQRIADGQNYVTLVRLAHQPDPSNNGRILIAFTQNGMSGVPIYESKDDGASWQFVMYVTDSVHTDHTRCNLRRQPNLSEIPRDNGSLKAGTLLFSADALCNDNAGVPTEHHIQLYGSTDIGRSWQYRSTIADGTADLPVWEPNIQLLDDGKLVAFYSDETHKADGYNQLLGYKISTDGGKSWGSEIYDVAQPGGVERPGMSVLDRLPDHRYVMTYEDVDGPIQSQVHLKYSSDGLDWHPSDRGTPIQTEGGQYPINCPTVRWFPFGGPSGLLLVSARGTGGGGDPVGNSFYWNNNNGVGPWWEVREPVQKLGGNTAVGWTQAMMLKPDGSILHISSSALPGGTGNQILFNAAKLDFNRYEAEDASRRGSSLMRDPSMSNGAKIRLGANDIGHLAFHVHMARSGPYALVVNYASIGFKAMPRLIANGDAVQGMTAPAPVDPAIAVQQTRDLGTRGTGEHIQLSATANLRAGDNTIEILGGAYALDVDYLEVTPKG